jgi:hypothetical protein
VMPMVPKLSGVLLGLVLVAGNLSRPQRTQPEVEWDYGPMVLLGTSK